MGSSERLCLLWNDFESNIKQGFSDLRQEEDFFDVTLACGSQQIKAHKVILSACSPFFRSLIKSLPHNHPLLYLRGVNFAHLESLLGFMYNGEVSVVQEDLDEFLSIAEEFKVKGLTSSPDSPPPPSSEGPPSSKRPKIVQESEKELNKDTRKKIVSHSRLASPSLRPTVLEKPDDSDEDDVKVLPSSVVKTETKEENVIGFVQDEENYANFVESDSTGGLLMDVVTAGPSETDANKDSATDFEYYKQNKVTPTDCGILCLICGVVIRQKRNLHRHFSDLHLNDGKVYKCPACQSNYRSKNSFRFHVSQYHKLWKKMDLEKCSVYPSLVDKEEEQKTEDDRK